MTSEARVLLLQLSVPAYRGKFVGLLRARMPNLVVAAGSEYFDPTVRTADVAGIVDVELRNVYLLRRRLAFQRHYRVLLRRTDVWIVELNPRTISSWLVLLEGRLRGVPTIVWGHFTGRSIGVVRPGLGRRLQVRLAGRIVAYTYDDGEKFKKRFPRAFVHVAPNAAELATDVAPVTASSVDRTDFLYVGRLVESKGVGLLLEGFRRACEDGILPSQARLVMVGEGPMREVIRRKSEQTPSLRGRVMLEPSTFDSDALNALYRSAVAGVCGGYVGLNLTQSLSRGVPFVFPSLAAHAPEIALADEGRNAFPFVGEAPSALAQVLGSVWGRSATGRIDHAEIQRAAVSRYSVELMVAGFQSAIIG